MLKIIGMILYKINRLKISSGSLGELKIESLLFGFGLIGKEKIQGFIDLGICMPGDMNIV